MSTLTIETAEAGGPTVGAVVKATLVNYERVPVPGLVTATSTVISRPSSWRVASLPFSIDLVPNADIVPPNTYWMVEVAGDAFLITKGADTETIEDALAEDLEPLDPVVAQQLVDAAIAATVGPAVADEVAAVVPGAVNGAVGPAVADEVAAVVPGAVEAEVAVQAPDLVDASVAAALPAAVDGAVGPAVSTEVAAVVPGAVDDELDTRGDQIYELDEAPDWLGAVDAMIGVQRGAADQERVGMDGLARNLFGPRQEIEADIVYDPVNFRGAVNVGTSSHTAQLDECAADDPPHGPVLFCQEGSGTITLTAGTNVVIIGETVTAGSGSRLIVERVGRLAAPFDAITAWSSSASGGTVAAARIDAAIARLASPTFTGTPAAPTATAGTSTTQLATTAFVQAAVAALIAGAPGALDTLDELAAAFGDDANFAATMTTALAGKLGASTGPVGVMPWGGLLVGGTGGPTEGGVLIGANAFTKGILGMYGDVTDTVTEKARIQAVATAAPSIMFGPGGATTPVTGIAYVSAGVLTLGSTLLRSTTNPVGNDDLTRKAWITPPVIRRAVAITFAAAITPSATTTDVVNVGTLTAPITINAPSGSPVDGQEMTFRFTQDATGRAITWNAIYAFGTDVTAAMVPTTASAKFEIMFRYNTTDTKWRAISIARGF